MKKMYIGYDLGDGETILNILIHDTDQSNIKALTQDITMPGEKNSGKALPTIYGKKENGEIVFSSYIENDGETLKTVYSNFKCRPSDLVKKEEQDIIDILNNSEFGWPKEAEFNTEQIINFKNRVIEFTNAIFESKELIEQFKYKIEEQSEIGEIVVCVGHPTNWNLCDQLIYARIIKQSVLGNPFYMEKPLKFLVARESRAAFLYVKNSASDNSCYQEMAALIDVGSSTIDFTAINGSEKNSVYNSGHNYLGARIIDYLIYDWYVNKLKENEEYDDFLKLITDTPNMKNVLLLQCRLAKEKIYGTDADSAKIPFADFKVIRLCRETLEKIIENPIGDVLQNHLKLKNEVIDEIGKKSWKEEFTQFLMEQKHSLDEMNFEMQSVILTGSASKMPIVKEIAKSIFESSVYSDNDPSKTISKGLALAGYSNDKSEKFQKDADSLIKNDIPKILKDDLPEYAEELAKKITEHICDDIVLPEILKWKNGDFNTINDAMNSIKSKCSEANISYYIENDVVCKKITSNWLSDKLGKDIAIVLHDLCKKYNVNAISLEELNVLNIKANNVISSNFDSKLKDNMLNPADILINIITVITGILTAVVTPSIVGTIVGILMVITDTVGFLLFDLLLAMPGVGWAILVGLAGVGAAAATKGGLKSMKTKLSEKLLTVDLPAVARKLVSDEKLRKTVSDEKNKISNDIKKTILEEKSCEKIVNKIETILQKQLGKIIDNMKYIIESK